VDTDLFSFAHPLWLWLGGAALLLTAEVVTGTSWLLWPAVSAAVVGLLTALGLDFPLPDQLALFAVLSVVSTFISHRFTRRRRALHPETDDVNDAHTRLLGRSGEAVTDFRAGRGRVLVDGAEWRAELESGEDLPFGAPIEVVARLDGARLQVRPR
jgi:membrane protein implicated in regulation of membrane protease activity